MVSTAERLQDVTRDDFGGLVSYFEREVCLMEIINGKKMFDVTEVSQMTTVSVRTVEKYLRSGKMHGVKIRGHWLVSETSVNEFLDGKTWNDDQVK